MSTPLYIFLVFISQWMHFILGTGNPNLNYHPPIDIPLALAANFGELRPNHFHMGLDLKTNGKEGLNLYSIDQGFVARVSISPYGYGNVVYINHPGGITSVYAHCSNFVGSLKTKVEALQKQNKSSQIEIYFQPKELIMKRGEIFALSGNSGSSSGPHLHFEIRDTYTDEAFNPLLFGFNIADSKAPDLEQIKIYSLDEKGYLMNKSKEYRVYRKDGIYTLGTPVVVSPNFFTKEGGIGFAISGTDRFDAFNNPCGFYGIRLSIDNEVFIEQKLDKIKFEHTRYLNTYTDYEASKNGKKFHKSFRNVTNPLQVYNARTTGIYRPAPGTQHRVKYEVYDVAGNSSTLEFDVQISEGPYADYNTISQNYIDPAKAYTFSRENGEVYAPQNCTYEPMSEQLTLGQNSLTFGSERNAVQEMYTVKLRPRQEYPIAKQYLCTNGTRPLHTIYQDGWLQGKAKYFGQTTIETDINGPIISPVNLRAKTNRKTTSKLLWRITDNESGLMDYGLIIDAKWEVLNYESKGNFGFYATQLLSDGPHEIRVTATDNCGNQTTRTEKIEIY